MNTAIKLFFFIFFIGAFLTSSAQMKLKVDSLSVVKIQSKAQSSEFSLLPLMARGGEISKMENGNDVIFFPASSPTNEKIDWKLENSVPSGLWEIEISFFQPEIGLASNQLLAFEDKSGELIAKIDLYNMGFSKGNYSHKVGLFNSKKVLKISLIKGWQRSINSVGITSIRIKPALNTSYENTLFVFQVPVNERKISLPIPLPAGVYIVNAKKKIALNWKFPDGRTFTTPKSVEQRVFLESTAQPFLTSGDSVSEIQLTHYPIQGSPDMSSAGKMPLMTLSDTTKIETQSLKLIGYKGKKLPQLDLLPNQKKMAVVTSWDDGQMKDIDVMELLVKYGMKGTFYMNRNSKMIPYLSQLEAKGMEIGAHSWSHPAFNNSTPKRCLDEAVEMRRFLEKELNHPVFSFAYPFNYVAAYDAEGDYVLRSIRQAGYWSGRPTTQGDNKIDSIIEPLAMRPNFHFNSGKTKIKAKFDQLLQNPGSILYIWGHSYELAGNGQQTLEEVLGAVGNHPDVWYATLGELMIWQYTRNQLQIELSKKNRSGNEFILKMPWLNPYLRQIPLNISMPEGVKEVVWKGEKIQVKNGYVQLSW
ncbi:MAG: polysaccharide deacetylase family protein [Paludibacter sp.]